MIATLDDYRMLADPLAALRTDLERLRLLHNELDGIEAAKKGRPWRPVEVVPVILDK